VKKRADMAMFAERRIGKPHRLVVLFAKFSVVLGGMHRVFAFLVKYSGRRKSPVRQSTVGRALSNWISYKLPLLGCV
jgi:hypothetical protein